jgi:hypothetical protein
MIVLTIFTVRIWYLSTIVPAMFNVCDVYFSRNDPPGKSISSATEELLRLSEMYPQGLPMNDLSKKDLSKDFDFHQQAQRQKTLEAEIERFSCVLCPSFEEHVRGFIACQSSYILTSRWSFFLCYMYFSFFAGGQHNTVYSGVF